jgi:hypothetical protein
MNLRSEPEPMELLLEDMRQLGGPKHVWLSAVIDRGVHVDVISSSLSKSKSNAASVSPASSFRSMAYGELHRMDGPAPWGVRYDFAGFTHIVGRASKHCRTYLEEILRR